MEKLVAGKLTIDFVVVRGEMTMKWCGSSDSRSPEEHLSPYFDSVVKEFSGRRLVIDFRSMNFMNSSTVKPIIHLLRQLDQSATKTCVVYDAGQDFQRMAFSAFASLARFFNNLEVESRAQS